MTSALTPPAESILLTCRMRLRSVTARPTGLNGSGTTGADLLHRLPPTTLGSCSSCRRSHRLIKPSHQRRDHGCFVMKNLTGNNYQATIYYYTALGLSCSGAVVGSYPLKPSSPAPSSPETSWSIQPRRPAGSERTRRIGHRCSRCPSRSSSRRACGARSRLGPVAGVRDWLKYQVPPYVGTPLCWPPSPSRRMGGHHLPSERPWRSPRPPSRRCRGTASSGTGCSRSRGSCAVVSICIIPDGGQCADSGHTSRLGWQGPQWRPPG